MPYEKYIKDAKLIADVQSEISKILEAYLPPTLGLSKTQIDIIGATINSFVFDDLIAFTTKNPTSKNNLGKVFKTYLTFKAVMYYRIANTIYYCSDINPEFKEGPAGEICKKALLETKIDINPAAKIGRRFVIDHGIGTIIGETCEIGDDCYILQGVILGAPGIAGNPPYKRHPTIGNKVQIGGFARIFGPVTVGDNVCIASYCMVDHNIPSNTKVVIINQLQISTPQSIEKICIYGVVPNNNGIAIYGENLDAVQKLSVANENFEEMNELNISLFSKDSNNIKISLTLEDNIQPEEIKKKLGRMSLKFITTEGTIYVTKSLGLKKAIDTLLIKGVDYGK